MSVNAGHKYNRRPRAPPHSVGAGHGVGEPSHSSRNTNGAKNFRLRGSPPRGHRAIRVIARVLVWGGGGGRRLEDIGHFGLLGVCWCPPPPPPPRTSRASRNMRRRQITKLAKAKASGGRRQPDLDILVGVPKMTAREAKTAGQRGPTSHALRRVGISV
jgi:hypothetical protein